MRPKTRHKLKNYRELKGSGGRSIGLWFLGHTPWIGDEMEVQYFLHCGKLLLEDDLRVKEEHPELLDLYLKSILGKAFKHGELVETVEVFDTGLLITVTMLVEIKSVDGVLRTRAKFLEPLLRGKAEGVVEELPSGWLFHNHATEPHLYLLGARELPKGTVEVLYYAHCHLSPTQDDLRRVAVEAFFSSPGYKSLRGIEEFEQGLVIRIEMAGPIRDRPRLVRAIARDLTELAELERWERQDREDELYLIGVLPDLNAMDGRPSWWPL